MNSRFKWPWAAPILIYTVSALEVIIMISPFAAYYYSVYTPLLNVFQQFETTAWLSGFFLPHLTRSDHVLFAGIEYIGPPLAVLGLLGFLVCAAQLYYGKFIRKKMVTNWIYARVRHPQYLFLAISGLGFLLMWPRFFVLMTYWIMLGFYYVLARHEEAVIKRKYGRKSTRYISRVPMFVPIRFNVGNAVRISDKPVSAYAFWFGLGISMMLTAFVLRMESKSQLYLFRSANPDITAVSFQPRSTGEIQSIVEDMIENEWVDTMLTQNPKGSFLLQIATGEEGTRHLLTDLGMKAGAVQMLRFAEHGEYAVLSALNGQNSPVDPFALTTRIEPLLLASSVGEAMDVRWFISEQFYTDFARIKF